MSLLSREEAMENEAEVETLHMCDACGEVARYCIHISARDAERCEEREPPICADCAEVQLCDHPCEAFVSGNGCSCVPRIRHNDRTWQKELYAAIVERDLPRMLNLLGVKADEL